MGRRLYDSETGRFMSVDPLYEPFSGHNPYHYAFNSPLIFRDPTGLAPEEEEEKEQVHGGEMLRWNTAANRFLWRVNQDNSHIITSLVSFCIKINYG
jgi:hypothetical protein